MFSLGIRSSLGFRIRFRFRVGIRCRMPHDTHGVTRDIHLHTCMRHIYSTHWHKLMGVHGRGDWGHTGGGLGFRV